MYGRSIVGDNDDDTDLYSGFGGGGSTHLYEETNTLGDKRYAGNLRFGTAQQGDDMRPMTSVKGAGYRSNGTMQFDPLAQTKATATVLKRKIDNGPEFLAKEMDREVNQFIVDSATAKAQGNYVAALDKAKEAVKRERLLVRHCEQYSLTEMVNADLGFAVQFNLAIQYTANSMMTEALNIYSVMVKSKQYANAGRLRVNMGNIYFLQKKYPSAIKMYRMAMDLVGAISKDTRFQIMRNIGIAFIRLGQFQDAIHAFESVMDGAPEPQSGFNLIVCYFALGDRDKMKKGFLQLMQVTVEGNPDTATAPSDELSKYNSRRQAAHSRYLLWAAKLIANVIEDGFDKGFQWLVSSLKAPDPGADLAGHHDAIEDVALLRVLNSCKGVSTEYGRLAMELELCKGICFLKQSDFPNAMAVFRSIGRLELDLHDQAACNLSFLYYLEEDYVQAKKYADLAIQENRYNASALVNRANIFFMERDYDNALEMYLEAIGVEADCVQAVYNLALVYKQVGRLEDSLGAFRKLHSLSPKNPEIIYQIADLYDQLELYSESGEWFKLLLGIVPNDGSALARLGRIASKLDDQTQAFHCFTESYQCNPTNMEVISWLGVWYVKSELYESAVEFFERAGEIEQNEIKWKLMVATCYRRMGSVDKALQLYKKIHAQEPDSVECLKYLCSIYHDTRQEALLDEYSRKLNRLISKNDGNVVNTPSVPNNTNSPEVPTQTVIPQQSIGDGRTTSLSVSDGATVNKHNSGEEVDFDGVELDDELLPM